MPSPLCGMLVHGAVGIRRFVIGRWRLGVVYHVGTKYLSKRVISMCIQCESGHSLVPPVQGVYTPFVGRVVLEEPHDHIEESFHPKSTRVRGEVFEGAHEEPRLPAR